jgi:hypothetical protein
MTESLKVAMNAWVSRNRDYLRSPEYYKNMYHLPSMARLWGYDQYWYRNKMAAELIFVTQAAGRRLTPYEREVYLTYASRSTVAQSYDCPAAILATLYMIRHGWTEYTFPFYQPTFQRFNPNAFPSTASPFLRGRVAAGAWQLVRCGLYGGLGVLAYVSLKPWYWNYMTEFYTILEVEPALEKLGEDIMETSKGLALSNSGGRF